MLHSACFNACLLKGEVSEVLHNIKEPETAELVGNNRETLVIPHKVSTYFPNKLLWAMAKLGSQKVVILLSALKNLGTNLW